MGVYDPSAYSVSEINSADFNLDGRDDLFFTVNSTQDKVEIFINNGDETFTMILVDQFSNWYQILIDDMNNDNYPDIVFTDNSVTYLSINNGNLTFSTPILFTSYSTLNQTYDYGDIDSDGDKDFFYNRIKS